MKRPALLFLGTTTLLILSLPPLALSASSAPQQASRSPTVVGLMLSRHYGYPSILCRLFIQAWEGDGSVSLKCGLSPDTIGSAHGGASRPERRRKLTAAESAELRGLATAARLFDGDYAGVDATASDGIFEILKVNDGRTAVLVTSGNPTFAKGPRKALLDWLHRQEEALRKDPSSLDQEKK